MLKHLLTETRAPLTEIETFRSEPRGFQSIAGAPFDEARIPSDPPPGRSVACNFPLWRPVAFDPFSPAQTAAAEKPRPAIRAKKLEKNGANSA